MCARLNASNGSVNYSVGDMDSLVYGTEAAYSCNTGFFLMGESSRTCGGNSVDGDWNGTEPTCVGECLQSLDKCVVQNKAIDFVPYMRLYCNATPSEILCSELTDPLNGRVNFTVQELTVGARAEFSCDVSRGFFIRCLVQ